MGCTTGKVVGGTQCYQGRDVEALRASPSDPIKTPAHDWSRHFVESFRSNTAVSAWQASFSEDRFDLHREGKASILWRNFVSVMENLGRKPSLFMNFLKSECSLESALAGDDRRMLRIQFRGFGLKERLQSVLEKFVDMYVKCRQCGSHATHLTPMASKHKLDCCSCKAQCFAEVVTSQLNIPAVDDLHCRYKMPALQAQVRGCGKMIRTVILNINDVAEALLRSEQAKGSEAAAFASTPESILRFFSLALGTDADMGTKSVGGSRTASKLQEVLRDYIDDFVACPGCHLPETDLHFDTDGSICGRCRACPWQGRLALTRSHSQKLAEQMFKTCAIRRPEK